MDRDAELQHLISCQAGAERWRQDGHQRFRDDTGTPRWAVSFEWLAEDYRTWEDEEDGWGLSAGVDPWPKPFGSSAALRRRVIESGDCWVCAGIADEADHLVPAREGGEYVEANLAPICSSCNKARYHDERRFGTWEKAYDLARIQGYDGPPPTRRG